MQKHCLIGLIFIFFVAGCQVKQSRNNRLLHIDSLQRIAPDSAFNLLNESNSLCLTIEDKAYYSLLYCETFLKKPLSFGTNQRIDTLIQYFQQQNEPEFYARALLCKSLNQYKQGAYKEALSNAIAAEQATESDDNYQQCLANQNLGRINLDNGCYERALQQFMKATANAQHVKGNKALIAECYLLEGRAYKRLRNNKKAMQCLQQALNKVDKREQHLYAEILTNLAKCYLDNHNSKKARQLLIAAYAIDDTNNAAMLIGNLWQAKGKSSIAKDYWYQAANSNDYETQLAALDSLLKLDPKNVFLLQLYQQTTRYAPRLNTDEIAQLQTDFEQAILQKKAYERINFLLVTLIVLIISAFFGYHYYKRKLKRVRQHLSSINARYLNDLEQYQQTRAEIKHLEQRIAAYQEDKQQPEQWNLNPAMVTSDCVFTLHRQAARGEMATDSLWQALNQLMASHDPHLFNLLITHNLNDKERHICMLIRLRFIPSELSTLLGISPQNATNLRQRLLVKLFNAKGGARDFDEKIRAVE